MYPIQRLVSTIVCSRALKKQVPLAITHKLPHLLTSESPLSLKQSVSELLLHSHSELSENSGTIFRSLTKNSSLSCYYIFTLQSETNEHTSSLALDNLRLSLSDDPLFLADFLVGKSHRKKGLSTSHAHCFPPASYNSRVKWRKSHGWSIGLSFLTDNRPFPRSSPYCARIMRNTGEYSRTNAPDSRKGNPQTHLKCSCTFALKASRNLASASLTVSQQTIQVNSVTVH